MQSRKGDGQNVEIEQFLQDIKEVLREGQELLKGGVAAAREQTVAGARFTDKYLREHPYQTLGIAVGLGVVAGILMAGLFAGGGQPEED